MDTDDGFTFTFVMNWKVTSFGKTFQTSQCSTEPYACYIYEQPIYMDFSNLTNEP